MALLTSDVREKQVAEVARQAQAHGCHQGVHLQRREDLHDERGGEQTQLILPNQPPS